MSTQFNGFLAANGFETAAHLYPCNFKNENATKRGTRVIRVLHSCTHAWTVFSTLGVVYTTIWSANKSVPYCTHQLPSQSKWGKHILIHFK